jgi:hypothetical protein
MAGRRRTRRRWRCARSARARASCLPRCSAPRRARRTRPGRARGCARRGAPARRMSPRGTGSLRVARTGCLRGSSASTPPPAGAGAGDSLSRRAPDLPARFSVFPFFRFPVCPFVRLFACSRVYSFASVFTPEVCRAGGGGRRRGRVHDAAPRGLLRVEPPPPRPPSPSPFPPTHFPGVHRG